MTGFLKQAGGWLVVNVFLLAIILVGAAAFWLLGAGVRSLSLDDEIERWLLLIVGVVAIFASYYAGKFLHDTADRMQRRPKR